MFIKIILLIKYLSTTYKNDTVTAMKGYIICGATATGKTSLSIELAKKVNGEVISADSRQVYKHLNIGTAKVTTEEMDGILHHLIDIFEPSHTASVVEVAMMAHNAIEDIISRGKTPIVAGGTGFYIDSFVKETISEMPDISEATVKKYSELSKEELQQKVRALDPILGLSIDTDHHDRMARALSIIEIMGSIPQKVPVVFSQPIEWVWVGLSIPRTEHQELIKHHRADNARCEAIIQETKTLIDAGILTHERCQSLGLEYKLASLYLQHEISLEELAQQLFHKICQYAKRQETWFKRNNEISWFNLLETKTEDIIKAIK